MIFLLAYLESVGGKYDPKDWRLFIDSSSKTGLCACLIYNKKDKFDKRPIVPLLFSTSLTESYDDLEKVLTFIGYEKHQWRIVSDLKILNCLMGLKSTYCKYCCFYCLWDSRFSDKSEKDELKKKANDLDYHYCTKSVEFDMRDGYEIDDKNASVIRSPLVDINQIILPPLHIKLGVFSQFIKSLAPKKKLKNKQVVIDKAGNTEAIKFLVNNFRNKSEDKIVAGTFVGPEIRKLIEKHNDQFTNLLNHKERACWLAYVDLWHNFFGNHRSQDYVSKVDNLIKAYHANEIHVSPKLHYLINHLDHFPSNNGLEGEEMGEQFHQIIKVFLRRFKDKLIEMLSFYCWTKNLKSYETFKNVRKPKSFNFFLN